MFEIAEILAELTEFPEERLAVALADAVFYLSETDVRANAGSRRFDLCLTEAEVIRRRLKAHGFDIVSAARAQALTEIQLNDGLLGNRVSAKRLKQAV